MEAIPIGLVKSSFCKFAHKYDHLMYQVIHYLLIVYFASGLSK